LKTIPLTQNKFALVDDEDYQDLSQYKWYARRDGNIFYATRSFRVNKKQSAEQMHRRILGLNPGDGKETDHIDMDGLNNQRNNLRIATKGQNEANQIIYRNNTSGFKGVHWSKGAKKWMARIKIDSQSKYLGLFESKIDAALAYNKAAIRYFGEFARINQIVSRGK